MIYKERKKESIKQIGAWKKKNPRFFFHKKMRQKLLKF